MLSIRIWHPKPSEHTHKKISEDKPPRSWKEFEFQKTFYDLIMDLKWIRWTYFQSLSSKSLYADNEREYAYKFVFKNILCLGEVSTNFAMTHFAMINFIMTSFVITNFVSRNVVIRNSCEFQYNKLCNYELCLVESARCLFLLVFA